MTASKALEAEHSEGESDDDMRAVRDQDEAHDHNLEDQDLLAEPESGAEDLDPQLHSSWMFICESDEDEEELGPGSKSLPGTRVKAFDSRPEFLKLEAEGLTSRPAGYSIGVHPSGRQWRAFAADGRQWGRSWGKNRSPRQALLRVLQLMMEAYCDANKQDRLARKQLQRIINAREAEEPHRD